MDFHGQSAHAGAAPWNGLNALDAAVATYVSVSTLRQYAAAVYSLKRAHQRHHRGRWKSSQHHASIANNGIRRASPSLKPNKSGWCSE